MLYPIKWRSWLYWGSLPFVLSLVLVLGTQRGSACGGSSHKTCTAADKKAGEHSCPYHSKATQAAKNQTYTCPMHSEVTSEKPGNCDKCGMKLVLKDTPAQENIHAVRVTNPEDFKKVKRYTCPMHSEVVQKRGGKCSECGMKLTKAEFYEVYACPMEECPQLSYKDGKCCGEKMNKKLMSSEEFGKLTSVTIEYACPMHPEVTSDKPGDCSKCGMKLKKSASLEEKSSEM